MGPRKTNYFGTFLETLSTATRRRDDDATMPNIKASVPSRRAEPSSPSRSAERADSELMNDVVNVLPNDPDARLSVVDVARTLGASIGVAAAALKALENLGLVNNVSGRFALTELGREAATLDK